MTPLHSTTAALADELTILGLYLDLPETPAQINPSDRQVAQRWCQRQIPIRTVKTALLLGSLRRLYRPAEALPLAPIRSLAYFQPVVEELLLTPLPDGYDTYLQGKLKAYRRDPGLDPPAGPL
jgi:hypothetical protein